jgi:hypothetical protein
LGFSFSRPDRQHFVQNAYHVADLDEAIGRFHAVAGLGPFLVRRHIPLEEVAYRGAPASLDISAAMVQSGALQIELIQQHCDSPSAFRDMFARDEEGLHHVALFPEDHDAMLRHYRRQGFEVATSLVTAAGGGADYVDARRAFGHMIEIYRMSDRILRLYEQVAQAASQWDGSQLIVEM